MSAALAALVVFGVPTISQAAQAQQHPLVHADHRRGHTNVDQASGSRGSDGSLDLGSHPSLSPSITPFGDRYGLAQDEVFKLLATGKLSATAGVPETKSTGASPFLLSPQFNGRAAVHGLHGPLNYRGDNVRSPDQVGSVTRAKMRHSQSSRRLSHNSWALGVPNSIQVASATASPKMEAPPPKYPPGYLHEGDVGASVRILQHDLTVLGYPTGGVDGIFGTLTLRAVQTFQRDQGLPAYGLVGSLTWGAIHRLLTQKRAQAPVNLSNRGSVSATAGAVIGLALKYLGYPYVYGGNTPSTGFDCSGFVQWVYAQVGISLPRTTFTQWNVGTHVSYDQLQPGDLVFFTTEGVFANHVGIYLGNGEFISATEPGKGVMIQSLNLPFFAQAYDGAVQVIP
ncbi:MAG: hydrolase Nlp/P60 [Sulfobacillus acidophilus]|uniref:Hydrolase Nlp/P60 n=1 Tax=Sulfobacillus acidophilus TaxID=53633 RepID=A0A2T2WK38_9FIRM|nr:MAG: hydrolase Nlp/P60 [Sulfobacillus acidophilus]